MSTNRIDLEGLIPIEESAEVIQVLAKTSAIEDVADPETMTSDTKTVKRFGGFDVATVAKGADYGFSTVENDEVDMVARKIGGAAKVAEEDLVDTVTGEGTMRRIENQAGDALAKNFDNACIGTTAAMNGTTVPFESIYYTLSTAQTLPGDIPDYVAGDNITSIERGSTSAQWQDAIIKWLAAYEESDFYDEGNTFLLASPMIKSIFRGVRDTEDNPVFVTSQMTNGSPSLFGYSNFRLTTGARTSAVMSKRPTGNPLVVIGNKQLVRRGLARTSAGMVPGNPGVQWQRAANGIGFISDEAIMKAMMRRAFAVMVPQAVSVLEIKPDSTP